MPSAGDPASHQGSGQNKWNKQNTRFLMAPTFFKIQENRPLCEYNFCGLLLRFFSSLWYLFLYGKELGLLLPDCPFLAEL